MSQENKVLDSAIQNFLNLERNAEASKVYVKEIASLVRSQNCDLHAIVVRLGDALTNQDELLRSRAVSLFGELLDLLADVEFSEKHISLMVNFLAARSADYSCGNEIIMGLRALFEHQKVESNQVCTSLRVVFRSLHIPTMPQRARMQMLKLLRVVLRLHTPAALSLNADFVLGVVQSFDGERDPRNLLVGFRLLQETYAKVPSSPRYCGELFEVTSCYFPISFRQQGPRAPQVGDASEESLNEALFACFTVLDEMAELIIPFLLEKLLVEDARVKMQTLRAISHCVGEYAVQVIKKQIPSLWSALRSEIFAGTDAQVVEHALVTLRNIVNALARNQVIAATITAAESAVPMQVNDEATEGKFQASAAATLTESSALQELLHLLLKESIHVLQTAESQSKLALSAGQVMRYAVAAHVLAAQKVLPLAIRAIQSRLVKDAGKAVCVAALLRLLNQLAVAAASSVEDDHGVQQEKKGEVTLAQHPLAAHAAEVMQEFLKNLPGHKEESQVRKECLSGLCVLCCGYNAVLLDEKQASACVRTLCDVLLTDANKEVRAHAQDCLADLCADVQDAKRTALLLTHAFQPLMDSLQKVAQQALLSEKEKKTNVASKASNKTNTEEMPAKADTAVSMVTDQSEKAEKESPDMLQLTAALVRLASHQQLQSAVFFEFCTMAAQLITSHAVEEYSALVVILMCAVSDVAGKDGFQSQIQHGEAVFKVGICLQAQWEKILVSSAADAVRLSQAFRRCLASVVGNASVEVQHDFLNLLHTKIIFQEGNDLLKPSAHILLVMVVEFFCMMRQEVVLERRGLDFVTSLFRQSLQISSASKPWRSLAVDARRKEKLENPTLLVAKMVASLVNKVDLQPSQEHSDEEGQGNGNLKMVEEIKHFILSNFEKNVKHKETPDSSLFLSASAWITKGFVLRGDSFGYQLTKMIFQLLHHENLALLASQCIHLIMKDSEGLLQPKYHARVQLFYKQRIFAESIQGLRTQYESSTQLCRQAHFATLLYLLTHIPSPVLLAHLEKLLPMIVATLQEKDPSLLSSSIQIVSLLIQEAPSYVVDHLDTFINALLSLSTFRPSMKVRTLALQTLSDCVVSFSYPKLYPFKDRVVFETKKCLDDHKRTVRRAAALARNRWITLRFAPSES